jgi:hypothetical protein
MLEDPQPRNPIVFLRMRLPLRGSTRRRLHGAGINKSAFDPPIVRAGPRLFHVASTPAYTVTHKQETAYSGKRKAYLLCTLATTCACISWH